MITQIDVETVEAIKELIEPMIHVGETQVNWDIVQMKDTLDKLVHNLRIADVSYCVASDEDLANRYYTAECGKCDWWGSSKLLNGGGQIADTGDYFDCTCPVCDSDDIYEKQSI